MNILNNGIVMTPGKELDQYARARGLCRLCGQTQTHKKAGRFLKKLRGGWEPITVKDGNGSYSVYKGYCIQPTCYSLEQAKRQLGEQSLRSFGDDRSITNSLSARSYRPPTSGRSHSRLPSHPSSPLKTSKVGSIRGCDMSTMSITSASNWSDDDSYRQQSIVSALTSRSNAQVPVCIDAKGSRTPVLPVKQILETFVEDPKLKTLNLSNVELFELNISSIMTALATKKLTTGQDTLDALLADKCKVNGNRLVRLFEGLLQHGIEVTKLSLRANDLDKVAGLTNFLKLSKSLTELNMAKNRLTDSGVAAVIGALSKNSRTRLTKLNLARNQLWTLSDNARSFFSTNQTITTLNLENNFLRDAGVGLLATAIAQNENSVLETLSLGNNAFGHFGAESLAELLRKNRVLHTLGITGNEIGDKGASSILQALESNHVIREVSGLYANRIADRKLIHSIEKCLEERAQVTLSRAFSRTASSQSKEKAWNPNDSMTDITFCPESQHCRKPTPSSHQRPTINELDETSNSDDPVLEDDSGTLSSSSEFDDFDDDSSSASSSQGFYQGNDLGQDLDAILPLPNISTATSTATGLIRASSYRGALEALDLASPSQHTRLVEGSEQRVGALKTFCLRASGKEEDGFETIAFKKQSAGQSSPSPRRSSPYLQINEDSVEVALCPPPFSRDSPRSRGSTPSTRVALEMEIEACKEALSATDGADDRAAKKKRIRLRKRLVELIPLRRSLLSRPELEQSIAEIDMTLTASKKPQDPDLTMKLESERESQRIRLQEELAEEKADENGKPKSVWKAKEKSAPERRKTSKESTKYPLAARPLSSNPCDILTLFQAAPLSYVDHTNNERHVLPLLDFQYESRVLKQALKDAERIGARIEIEHEIATTDRLSAFFAQGGRRLLHLSCHGHPDWLALENGFGDMQPLFVDDLRSFIEAGDTRLDFVFISACHSLPAGEAFLRAGVPHVVCARQDAKFRDEACAEFARCFYRALACNKTLRQAFKMAKEAVRVSPLVKDAKIESDKFLLLPERDEDSSYHDVHVFFTDDRSGPSTSNSPSRPTRILQRVPLTYVGREAEMYRVLEALRCTDLVQVSGGKGSGKSTLVAAVAKYIQERGKSFLLDEVIWTPNDAVGENDAIATMIDKAMSLVSSAKGSIKLVDSYKDTRGKLLQAIHGKRLLLIVDARDFTSAISLRNLEQFLKDLLQSCSIKIILVGDANNIKISRITCRTIEIGPLDFETSTFLFSRLVHSGRFSAPELAKILLQPKSKKPFHEKPTYPLRRNTVILERIGGGIPSDIEQAAAEMTEKDLLELVRIAQRPCPTVSTRAELEEEIQKRLSEEAAALRKKHYLRARDLRDLIDELQGLRQYLKTLEELTLEIATLRERLEAATKTRNYDSASNIQKHIESLEKQMEMENRWKEQWREDRFDRITAKARDMRRRVGNRRASA